MNDTNSNPPILPGQGAAPTPAPGVNDPEPLEPVTGFFPAVEAILRQPRRVLHQLRQPGAPALTSALLGAALGSALVYGLVVGTFTGGLQLWAAPLKVAGGLLVSALICLPSLYIFACLGGSQARLGEVAGMLAGMLALMTLLLLGFAPVAWVFSQSTDSLAAMGFLHLLFLGVATIFALRLLTLGFRQTQARSLAGVRVWMVILVLVMLQMTTALRPIIGSAPTPLPQEKRFFTAHWLDCLGLSGTSQSRPANDR